MTKKVLSSHQTLNYIILVRGWGLGMRLSSVLFGCMTAILIYHVQHQVGSQC